MKRFAGIIMAVVSTLTACAFGFSGCSKASDVVTEEEWIAAMSIENALNVTMKYMEDNSLTLTQEGKAVSKVQSVTTTEAKMALDKIETQSSEIIGNVSGNMSYIVDTTYIKNNNELSDYLTTNSYSLLDADSLTCVYKETIGGIDLWYGEQSDVSGIYSIYTDIHFNHTAYYRIENWLTEFKDDFSNFEYSDGAYKGTTILDGYLLYDVIIKINEGRLTYINLLCTQTESFGGNIGGYNYDYDISYEIKFSNYGTTTVEIPEEYTYDYYLANNA